MAVPQKGLRSAASILARRKVLLPALLAAVAAALLSAVVVYRAALADALLAQLQATAAQKARVCTADQVHNATLYDPKLAALWIEAQDALLNTCPVLSQAPSSPKERRRNLYC